MKTAFKLTILSAVLTCALAQAQTQASTPVPTSSVEPSQAGIDRMKAIIAGVATNSPAGVSEQTQQAIETGLQSAKVSADVERMDARTVDFAVEQSAKWQQMAREAYVAALPPRDRALGASVLLGDGTGGKGQMFIFVSRSMPPSLLRAYAVDAFYLGAKLVVKGVRKGDTLKEYIAEAMEQFNSTDGMTMAALDINPNLFDMFNVQVVPAVVWTDRIGLDDIGSGCENLPEGAPVEKLSMPGPYEELITVDRPTCAKVPDTAYYKISGALKIPYVLDRFQEAGLSKVQTDVYRARLAERTGNVHDGSVVQSAGNAMAPLGYETRLDRYPKHVLANIQKQLQESNVQRGPFGPTFVPDDDDDVGYRQELQEKIRHGLGL